MPRSIKSQTIAGLNSINRYVRNRQRNERMVHVVECFELDGNGTRVAIVGMCFDTRFEAEMWAADNNGKYIGERKFGEI